MTMIQAPSASAVASPEPIGSRTVQVHTTEQRERQPRAGGDANRTIASDRPLRVLVTTSVSLKAGFDGSTMLPIQVIRGLKAQGIEVQIAHLRWRPLTGRVVRDEFEGTPYFTVPPSRWVSGLEAIRREFAFDLIHAEHYGGATRSSFAAIKHGWPLVYQVHSLLGDEVERDRLGRGLKFQLNRAVERRVCRHAAAVTVLGHPVKRVMVEEKGVPQDRVFVIHPGMDLTPYENPGPPAAIPGVAAEDRVVMYVGNIEHPNQGVPLLIDALPAVVAAVPRVRCVLVGGPMSAGLAYQARLEAVRPGLSEHLIILDHQTPHDIVGLTQRADVLVHPRLACRENYSVQTKMAVYLAARRPIVATDFGDYQHLLGDTGAGWLTPVSPEGIAQGIIRVLNDSELAARLASKTWNVAREQVCTVRNAQKYAEVYRTILAKAPRR